MNWWSHYYTKTYSTIRKHILMESFFSLLRPTSISESSEFSSSMELLPTYWHYVTLAFLSYSRNRLPASNYTCTDRIHWYWFPSLTTTSSLASSVFKNKGRILLAKLLRLYHTYHSYYGYRASVSSDSVTSVSGSFLSS